MDHKNIQENRLERFVFLPRYLGDMVFDGEITTQEFLFVSWIRLLSDPYGVTTTSLEDLAHDLNVTKNRANKIVLGLKKKSLLDYKVRSGKRGTFKIYLDYWSLPNKGGTRQRYDFYSGIPQLRPIKCSKNIKNIRQRFAYQKQSSEEECNVTPQDLNVFLTGISSRGTNTDTHTNNDTDILSLNKSNEEAFASNGSIKKSYFDANKKRIVEVYEHLPETSEDNSNTKITELESYKEIGKMFKSKPSNQQP